MRATPRPSCRDSEKPPLALRTGAADGEAASPCQSRADTALRRAGAAVAMTLTCRRWSGFATAARSGDRGGFASGDAASWVRRRCDGALASEVHDDAIGVVERVDACARVAFKSSTTRVRWSELTPDANLTDDVVWERTASRPSAPRRAACSEDRGRREADHRSRSS